MPSPNPQRQEGWVVSFTKRWGHGPRPIRVSVIAERYSYTRPNLWTPDLIAGRLVSRACLLLGCRPRDLRVKLHPADGPIMRYFREFKR